MGERPNILLFLTDDHGPWALGCYGNREVRSPVLDGLAAEGVRFAEAFTPSPVCSPARACLLTGRTPSQVGVHDWIQDAVPAYGDRDWLADELSLPELLAGAGYHTGLSGKWHLGRTRETPRGLAWYFGLPGWQGDHIETYTYVLNGELITLAGNKSRVITDHALRFLEAAPAGRPWFLQVGYIATHSPYAGQDPALTASYAGATFADIPPYVPHPWRQNEGFRQSEQFAREDVTAKYASYYAAVTEMDTQAGRLLAWLREAGQLDTTLVVYVSDHGLALGHQGFWGKGNSTRPLNMYEISIRVPLILRWPAGGLAGGRVAARPVDHYDTFLALCAAAGLAPDPARAYPGRSLLPLARGEAAPGWRDARFGEYGDTRMVRRPGHKLVRRFPAGPDDLFDLRADPGERENLAGRPALAALEAELRAELDAWYAAHERPERSGLLVKALPQHNRNEAWRDGIREARGLQIDEKGAPDGRA
jgi:arylsulfatase A-like enzyme